MASDTKMDCVRLPVVDPCKKKPVAKYFWDPKHINSSSAGSINSSGAGSINSSSTDFSSIINPGCRERALKAYRPVKTARRYHHPPIVHYAKFHGGPDGSLSLTFVEYLSMLSAYKVLQPKIIFLHSNGRFVGKYWNITQTWTNTTVRVNIIEKLTHFGKVKIGYIEHNADYAKLSQVLKTWRRSHRF